MSMAKRIILANGGSTLVDSDFDDPRPWYRFPTPGRTDYVVGHGRRADGSKETVRLHRMVVGAKPGELVDHINGDGLDNRLENLRICNAQENSRNTKGWRKSSSTFKGVSLHRASGGKWRALIGVGGKSIYLGIFNSEEEAARAYDEAARHHFGEFANLNFP